MTSEDHSPSAVTEFAAEPNYVIVHNPTSSDETGMHGKEKIYEPPR
jgi:hypothetical protein